MEGFAYLCALLLAAAFVRAGAAKLARPGPTEAGFRALGLPFARPASKAVPLVELAVAVVLVALPAVGGVVAFALLGLFTLVLARAIRAGVSTGCTCFGAVSREPVSRSDVLRNLLLAAAAATAWSAPAPTVPSPAAVALLVGALGAATAVLRFSRRHGPVEGPR